MRFSIGQRGITSLEVAVGVSIAALILTFAANAIAQFINVGRTVTEKTQALYLAEEGLELVRFMRDTNWANMRSLTVGTPYYITVTASAIGTSTTPTTTDGFWRSFTLQNVYRNSSTDDIVPRSASGAVVDLDSKYVTVSVRYGNPTTTVSLTSILADLDP